MRCAKCGAELKVGCIYCSVCGQEAQIVSDDNLLEEELLRQLLFQEEQESERTGLGHPTPKPGTPSEQGPKSRPEQKSEKYSEQKPRKKNHGVLITVLILIAAILALAVTLFFVLRQRNGNSFEYQLEKARQCVADRNYTKALAYYQRALELEERSVSVRMEMVTLYEQMEEPAKTISLLHEVIELDKSNIEAYQKLIDYYQDEEDYDSILKLQEGASDRAVLALFEGFQVEPPAFSLEPGSYQDHIEVELSAPKGCEIYYSLNGSDPAGKGTLYTEPISLDEQGELTIRAVARNPYGLYSEVLEGEFEVKYEKPQMPRAYPDSGSFFQPTTIELSGVEGGHMYYTWDNTDPTANSTEYTGPIEVPEGNNILSVILIDAHGMVSDVLKCNYKYLPSAATAMPQARKVSPGRGIAVSLMKPD